AGSRSSPSRSLEGRQVLGDDGHRLLVLAGRAELDDFGAGSDQRDVPGRRAVGVAGLVDLVVVGEAERDPALDDVAPVRALAAVVGQALEERSPVAILAERLEADRVTPELLVAALHQTHVLDVGCGFLRSPGHGATS